MRLPSISLLQVVRRSYLSGYTITNHARDPELSRPASVRDGILTRERAFTAGGASAPFGYVRLIDSGR